MSRWSLPVLCSLLWSLPLVVHAQSLKVLTPGSSLDAKAESSTSYIEVTGTDGMGAQVCSTRCEPNIGICTCPGATSTSSRLIYDPAREKLVTCNGETVTVEGAECSKSPGILTATTHVRLGKLKIIPKAAPDSFGLKLNTANATVRLEFKESAEDFWSAGYYSGFGTTPQFATTAAGTYKVYAADLSQHCLPTQSNDGVEVTVTEGGESEVTVLFSGTQCLLTVKRTLSEDSAGGVIETTPAGLVCGASPTSACTGRFAFNTQLTITPVPTGSAGYSFLVGDGCVPGNVPCKHTIQSDRTFTVNFNAQGSTPADAGTQEPDAGTTSGMNDSGTPSSDGGNDGAEQDGSTPDDGSSNTGNTGSNGDNGDFSGSEDGGESSANGNGASDGDENEGGGSSDGCSISSTSSGASTRGLALVTLLLGVFLVRRRASR